MMAVPVAMISTAIFVSLFLKFCNIAIGTVQDVWHPVRGSRHLLAEHFQRYFLGTFDNQFIVDMTEDEAMG